MKFKTFLKNDIKEKSKDFACFQDFLAQNDPNHFLCVRKDNQQEALIKFDQRVNHFQGNCFYSEGEYFFYYKVVNYDQSFPILDFFGEKQDEVHQEKGNCIIFHFGASKDEFFVERFVEHLQSTILKRHTNLEHFVFVSGGELKVVSLKSLSDFETREKTNADLKQICLHK